MFSRRSLMFWKSIPADLRIVRVSLRSALARRPFHSTAASKSSPSTTSHITTRSIETRDNSPPLPFDSMPGPTFFENLTTIWKRGIQNFHHILADSFEKYGPIFKVKIPDNSYMVYVSDPVDIERVFRATENLPIRPNIIPNTTLYLSKKGLQEGILGNDESWYRHRSTVAPKLLRPPEIQQFISGLDDIVVDSIALLKDGRNDDLVRHLQKWSTESVAFIAFGRRIGVNHDTPDEKALALIDAVCCLLKTEAKLMFSLPLHRFFTTPALKELYGYLDTIFAVTENLVEETKKQGGHFQEAVVENLFNDHRLRSEDEMLQVILTVFAGGVHPTSMGSVGVLYNLSKFHEVQKKLYEEIRSVLPRGEKPTRNHLANMPYLKATIRESLRVTPATLGTARQLSRPIVLHGFEIPEKTTMNLMPISSKAMARRIYGDFENFRPERWLRGTNSVHHFAALPFGFGQRMCLGKRLAEVELSLLIIRLLQRFEIEYCDLVEDEQRWIFNITMEPAKPFNLDLKIRG